MAKQIEDKKTAELLPHDLAPVPAKIGRPTVADKPMTAAERKARSRFLQREAAAKDYRKPYKMPVSVEVDLACSNFLKQIAKEKGLTLAQTFELMVSEYVTSHKIESDFGVLNSSDLDDSES